MQVTMMSCESFADLLARLDVAIALERSFTPVETSVCQTPG